MAATAKMPTSPTDPSPGGSTLLVLMGEEEAFATWALIGADGMLAGGNDPPVAQADGSVFLGLTPIDGDQLAYKPGPGARVVLVVPGTEVSTHWLDLAGGLAPAQAAAAARLMLADASATPLADMHVAVGRAELGLTPAALVPAVRMESWLAATAAMGLDPDAIVPEPLLIVPPDTGFVMRDRGGVADYRGQAAAFTLEPELAEAVTGASPVEPVNPARFAATLPAVLAAPPLDLRQGAFARRRQWKIDAGWKRRIAMFAALLVILTLAVQIVAILRYTFAANRLEAELARLETPGAARTVNPGFGPAATRLFAAVQATPNLELTRIEYRPDGSLTASVSMDNAATFAAFRTRVEASGLAVEGGAPQSAGGRPSADFTVRPS
jgi:general secretion pathway protein L